MWLNTLVAAGIFSVFYFFGSSWGLVILIILIALWFVAIPAANTAIKLRMERPTGRVFTGTWTYAIWPFERFQQWPKEQVRIDLDPTVMISSSKVLEIKKDTPEGIVTERKTYSQVTMTVDTALYFNWPEDYENLIKSLKYAPNPKDMAGLKEHFQDFVLGVVRETLGSISYVEARQGTVFLREKNEGEDSKITVVPLREFVLEKLLTKQQKEGDDREGGEGNPILQPGLQNVSVVINKVTLPELVEKAISAPEIAGYEKTAAIIKAEGSRQAKILEGQGDAEAREVLFQKILALKGDGTYLEVLYTLREMAQGTSNTILYGLPPGIANMLKEKTGIEATEEQAGKFVNSILNALEEKKTK